MSRAFVLGNGVSRQELVSAYKIQDIQKTIVFTHDVLYLDQVPCQYLKNILDTVQDQLLPVLRQ